MTAGRLLVVGDLATDIVAVHDRPLTPATDTAARIAFRPGGAAANVAAWAAAAGAPTTLLARIGTESVDWHRRELERTGVTAVLRVDEERATAVVVCLVDATGERTMLNDRGAGAALGVADWDDRLLEGVDWVHLSGYLFFAEAGRALGVAVLDRCRTAGIGVSVDPASAGPLARLGRERFLALAAGSALLLPNLDEARLLSGAVAADRAALLLAERSGGLVVVKDGPRGVVLAADGQVLGRVPAPPATPVDTTGAGDAFTGAFLAARLSGADPLSAAKAGCAAGSEAVTRPGARPA
ncbi:carbohydrate kinase family protein [Streptacidiphilus rugosus]|uniref:carbohydrate kinase family protein n=1 Tax=Streptacidiphilus rugosus TaxID=405783 RepID=UPI00055A502D|nr:PfkB family carbohydrate kinase [Streptacidiphilus rugosus]